MNLHCHMCLPAWHTSQLLAQTQVCGCWPGYGVGVVRNKYLVNTRKEAEMNSEEVVGSVSLKAQNVLESLAFKDEIEILNIYRNGPLQSDV